MMMKFRYLMVMCTLLGAYYSTAQTTLNSIEELWEVIDDDNVNAVMTPGVYNIDLDDVSHIQIIENDASLFKFTGSNCTYDFTGVTFNFDTEIFMNLGNINVTEVFLKGSNIVLKNLTMVDIGNTRPRRTALGVNLSGTDNRVEGFHMTVRGSFPYGYGDFFGKGSGYVIKHFKHSAVLIKGERNHLKNSTIIHRAYGHGVFCQGSVDAVIEGVYLEGEVRSTDEVLAEEGTGSAADEVDFMTVFGYKVTPGWMFSLQEDGIRAYNRGTNPTTGVETNTENMRVIDCVVKNMRAGVTIGFCDGEKYVENVTALGTETGFWIGNGGDIIDCKGDAAYGPLYATQYDNDKNANIELTLIDSESSDELYGEHPMFFIGGSGHNITLHTDESVKTPEYEILIAGIRKAHRFEYIDENSESSGANAPANNITFNNYSSYPVLLEERCTNSTITSCGPVTDDGTGNTVDYFENCSENSCANTVDHMEAECFDDMSGVENEECDEGGLNLAFIQNGDYAVYSNIDLSNQKKVKVRFASKTSGGILEVRTDAVDGELLASLNISGTSGWQNWESDSINISSKTGVHDIYLVFVGGSGYLYNLNWFGFSTTAIPENDCAGVANGTASIDACGVCSGGTTGITPSSPQTWYADIDEDGLGDLAVSIEDCDQPTGYVSNADDTCPTDATNTCNDPKDCAGVANGTASIDACGVCSGGTTGITPSSPQIWYADIDEDGLGDPAVSIEDCDQPTGYVSNADDTCPTDATNTCNDTDDCHSPEYDITQVYDVANTIVKYEGKLYANKWYTKGIIPGGSNGPWKLVGYCDAPALICNGIAYWEASTVYAETGTIIVYNDEQYQNKYWSQNQLPGVHEVWEYVGPCMGVQAKLLAVTSIENTENVAVNVYPNPTVTEYSHVTLEGVSEDINWELVDAKGNVVNQGVFTSTGREHRLNFNGHAGIFYLKLHTDTWNKVIKVTRL